ncbi:MAG: sugar phosphate nucleotidyltransferase [bacterium]
MQAVILAAGESSRFWPLNQKHKSLIKIMGRPLIWHTLKNLENAGFSEAVIIQGPKKEIEEELKNYELTNLKIKYVLQEESLGTGSAIYRAKDFIKEPFWVLHPYKFYLKDIIGERTKTTLFAVPTNNPEDYGILKMESGKVVEICENPPLGKAPSNLRTLGIYFLTPDFFNYYEKIKKHHPEDLIDALNLLIKERGADTVVLEKELPTLKYPWDLFSVLEYLLKDIETKIYIGKNCQISPSCHLRGFVSIGDNCKIGNGVEIKNSIIGDNSKIPHLSYIGDSIIGENCNLGAGTITANLRFDKKTIKSKVKGNLMDTGREKFGCVLGNNTQTGINVSLMPGVLIGSNCKIGPASVVFENLEDNTIFYTEFKGVKKRA